jgi:hypothetical protein
VTALATAGPPVRLRSASFPAGDPASVRATGARLVDEADALTLASWRLDADRDAMSADRRWCSRASAAYDTASRAHTAHVADLAGVVRTAGQACTTFADALATAQASARKVTTWADRLQREQDALQTDWRRFLARRSAAMTEQPSVLAVGGLFVGATDVAAEQRALEARGAQLAADAARLDAQAHEADRQAEAASAGLVATLTTLTRLTTAARDRAATARHDALVAAGELAAEDGSVGSRVSGLLAGAASNVTDSVDLVVRLGGGHGDPLQEWRNLGAGLAHEVAHPLETLQELVDWRDVRQHDWGHWTGVEVPGGLLTAGSDGLFAVAKVLHGAQVLAGRRAVEEIRRLAEAEHLAAQTRALLAGSEGRTLSALVPVGGLAWHEAAGGHLLDRHVALTVAQLATRLRRETAIPAASTFTDRVQAEAAVSQLLAGNAVPIARWLGGTRPEAAFRMDVGRPVGVILRRGARSPVPGSVVKAVLVRDDSVLGYHVSTAFLVR